jgi:4-aminobutyrate aminotransferase-like enzyme
MASGHMNRVKRPDTWLHRPMLQNVKKILANPEPSTHGHTIRIAPPLVISSDQVDWALEQIAATLWQDFS